ncbi:response regulator [Paenibacillus puerhi]|uniref:response regulator n=1 Tax=Paenibacillus puerhi TaxID=2692622 RepID=UPI00135A47E8|nr:response regulator [Paenibacillus puerhi]
MINTILADDEPIIIRGLRKLIPWEELGITIVGEAWTGKGLLELIEKERPGLVVTDISMPDGTGIDVIKEIEKRGLNTKVIFISAYQEFSYAKDALAFGALDYLVKPVEKKLLLTAVKRAVTELQVESEEQTFKSKLAAYENKDKKTQLEELFDRLIEGDIRIEEASRRLQSLETGHKHSHYSILLIEPEELENDNRWGEHEKRLLLFAVSNLSEELIQRHAAGLVFRRADQLCAIVNHPPLLDSLGLADEIIDNVQVYLKIPLTIGVSRPEEGLAGIRTAYRTAAEALRRTFFLGGGVPVLWSEEPGEAAVSERELDESRQVVLQALLGKDRHRLSQGLEAFFDRVSSFARGSKDSAVTSCYSSVTGWSEGLREVGITPVEPWQEQQELLFTMQGFRHFGELKRYVEALTADYLHQLEAGGAGKEGQELQKVKEYIEQHYNENITLESMAAILYMNPYYFSSFFKKHTKMNFKQYLTEVRMKQALKLLLQTDLMVYEIAEQVGYNNARQFSDMFKKHFGKLPQEYKLPK